MSNTTRANTTDRPVSPAPADTEAPDAATTPGGDTRLSRTGAVLGRPDREHGAYGMVLEESPGETPSRDERAVRGLGPQTLPVDKK